jgi:hypothetical protein
VTAPCPGLAAWIEEDAVKEPGYWTSHYVTSTDPADIQRAIKVAHFSTGAETFELVHFCHASHTPNILISQGSGGHAYVFAEFGYHLHLAVYNVFIMPKHGDRTVDQLLARHHDALR